MHLGLEIITSQGAVPRSDQSTIKNYLGLGLQIEQDSAIRETQGLASNEYLIQL